MVARCVFPLSTATKLNTRNLGTRHRAGLGISEQSDAVVLIISEETGGISIAHEGTLTTDISMNQLPVLLQKHLTDQVYQPGT
ncbi:MAG: DNA integrity scanning protein DisA nucleotide-binding domain protein [Ignavibacteria bacterium]|nr:DNA integrity scanning protein DisA nucleotide-binding domain protein [Ignavibacteria bacterium]